jgi:hypothetical protein
MRKQLYNFISGQLLDIDGQPVKHIDIWNSQITFSAEEQPFPTPAVFIEFAPIAWRLQGNAVREAQVTVNLHIVTDSRVGKWCEVIEVFDLIDAITRRLHGAHADGVDALTNTLSTTDSLFGELMHNIETWSCHVTDGAAAPQHAKTPVQTIRITLAKHQD